MIDSKAAVMIAGTLAGAGIFSTLVYAWTRWILRPRVKPVDEGERLQRMEHALEMMAREIERLGEVQQHLVLPSAERHERAPSPVRGTVAYRPMLTPR